MKLGVIRQRHDEFYDRSRFSKMEEGLEWYETVHGRDRKILLSERSMAILSRVLYDDV